MTVSAMPIGRRTAEVTIGPRIFTIHEPNPRLALRVVAQFARLIGPSLAPLFVGASVEIRGEDGKVTKIGIAEILHSAPHRMLLQRRVEMLLADLDIDGVMSIIDSMLVGQVSVAYAGLPVPPVLLKTTAALETECGSWLDLVTMLRTALPFILGPLSAAAGTSAGTPPAATT